MTKVRSNPSVINVTARLQMFFVSTALRTNMVYTRSMKAKMMAQAPAAEDVERTDDRVVEKRRKQQHSSTIRTSRQVWGAKDINELFSEMLSNDRNWIESRFHDRLYETYFSRLFGSKEREAVMHLIAMNPAEDVVVDATPKRVGVCQVCDQIRTLSKIVKIGDRRITCGRRCANKYVLMRGFYKEMERLHSSNQEYRANVIKQVFDYLENEMKFDE